SSGATSRCYAILSRTRSAVRTTRIDSPDPRELPRDRLWRAPEANHRAQREIGIGGLEPAAPQSTSCVRTGSWYNGDHLSEARHWREGRKQGEGAHDSTRRAGDAHDEVGEPGRSCQVGRS